MNLVQQAVERGGRLTPLIIPSEITGGTGLMNPSIFIDDDGDILCVLRHINYTLYHSEAAQRFPSPWGVLSYLHPEKDQHLRTTNYLCRLDSDYKITDYCEVEMMNLYEPIWEFVGLEDARLTKWEGDYWISGVRRDTTPHGQGRMEVCQIEIDKVNWIAKEVYRDRIEVADVSSYCEKNWMPILDREYQFVKWCNPTEVVYAGVNPAEQVSLLEGAKAPVDLRGGSQVIPFDNGYYIAITHEVNLFKNYLGQKDGIYRHRIAVWDKDFKLIGYSAEPFSFLDGQIEFCAGLAQLPNGDFVATFGFQDNAAFVLEITADLMSEMVWSCL